ncbi:MAG: 30S ribosomal protein S20 [Patescibacteria group bacterium]
MPIKKAAKKHLRQSAKRRARNLAIKTNLKENIKNFRDLVLNKKSTEAKTQLQKCYKLLDKTAKYGVIKKNNASRKKSRLACALNKISK